MVVHNQCLPGYWKKHRNSNNSKRFRAFTHAHTTVYNPYSNRIFNELGTISFWEKSALYSLLIQCILHTYLLIMCRVYLLYPTECLIFNRLHFSLILFSLTLYSAFCSPFSYLFNSLQQSKIIWTRLSSVNRSKEKATAATVIMKTNAIHIFK